MTAGLKRPGSGWIGRTRLASTRLRTTFAEGSCPPRIDLPDGVVSSFRYGSGLSVGRTVHRRIAPSPQPVTRCYPGRAELRCPGASASTRKGSWPNEHHSGEVGRPDAAWRRRWRFPLQEDLLDTPRHHCRGSAEHRRRSRESRQVARQSTGVGRSAVSSGRASRSLVSWRACDPTSQIRVC
jgi:hypothetical protein